MSDVGGELEEREASIGQSRFPIPRRVTIREVGPRDGLQSEQPLPVEDRARLISAGQPPP